MAALRPQPFKSVEKKGKRRKSTVPAPPQRKKKKLDLSQQWLETRNAKHSWKLKVSQWGFDTSAITQQWLTFLSLLTARLRVHVHPRVTSGGEKNSSLTCCEANLTVALAQPKVKDGRLRGRPPNNAAPALTRVTFKRGLGIRVRARRWSDG